MSFIGDTLKDNNGAWDVVRLIAGPGASLATGTILVHMVFDPAIWDHLHTYCLGLGETWGAYAASVVGHSYAKT